MPSSRKPLMLTRLAPSPTGALHLGNARTFLVNWALARQNSWRVLLRIDDLDGPRVKPEATVQAIEDLRWLGLDWDEGPVTQTADRTPYEAALERLVDRGDAYPCSCTRTQILAASLSAPHAGEHELRYPGTCRPAAADTGRAALDDPSVAWRLATPDKEVAFDDAFFGPQAFNPQREVGDFLVATKGGQPSYQLATVVDDTRQGVTHIVRGADLLPSTARQLLLYDRLALGPPPTYLHLPLLVGEDGRRLAKRHGDTRVAHYRERGVAAGRVVALLARWCGVDHAPDDVSAAEFIGLLDLSRASRAPAVFTARDDAWLRGG